MWPILGVANKKARFSLRGCIPAVRRLDFIQDCAPIMFFASNDRRHQLRTIPECRIYYTRPTIWSLNSPFLRNVPVKTWNQSDGWIGCKCLIRQCCSGNNKDSEKFYLSRRRNLASPSCQNAESAMQMSNDIEKELTRQHFE